MLGIEGKHASDEALERYVLRHATDAECAQLEDHLLLCQQCREGLSAIEQFVACFRAVAPALAAEDRKHFVWRGPWERSRLPNLAVAASALALLLLGIPHWQTAGPERPLQSIELQPVRAAAQARVYSGGPLLLRLPLPDTLAGRVRVEVVDSGGSVEVSVVLGRAGEAPAELSLSGGLTPGQYWVRIFPEGGSRLAREFGLQVD